MLMSPAATKTDTRDDIIVALYDLFRRRGYDGVSISDISEATGLGKSSLYHHFPGGKPDMAEAVAAFARNHMRKNIYEPLYGAAPFARRIDAMMKTVAAMYDGGGAPCLVASMMISPTASPGAVKTVKAIIEEWIAALVKALAEEGIASGEAKRRATAAIIAIQGALVVARASGEKKVFDDAIKTAKAGLLGR